MAFWKHNKGDAVNAGDAKELGVSPGIVASGEMFKHGLIWGAVGTAAAWTLLAFGRREGPKNVEDLVRKTEHLQHELNAVQQEIVSAKGAEGTALKGNFIDTAAKFLEKWHGKIKEGIADAVRWTGKKFGKDIKAEHSTGAAITATSFMVGGIAGKLALPGAAVHGNERGKEAIRKYSDVKAKNKELEGSNVLLAEDVARLNAALAQAKLPDIAAEKEAAAGASRSV